ncbi:MAG: type IX secretion system protein PorQ [Bacteroidales bacterium]|nr:type IX secretion system protein PorQ [Bacteroidales bacterium]
MSKLRLIAAALSVSAALGTMAQDGTTAYEFLNMPLSTRIYGLGGVNISLVDDDVTTIDQNPALLGQEMEGQLALSYMRYVGDSNFAGIRYANSVGEHGAWSAAIQYFGYGSIREMDETGTELGTISPKDVAFMGAYSHDITDNLRGGFNLKAAYSSYAEYTAWAIGVDLGINYFDADRDLSLSAVVANLGGQVKKFHESYDRMPIDVRLGWSQSFGNFPIRFSITAWNLTKWKLPYYEYGDGASDTKMELKESFSSNLFRHLVFGADLISSPNWYLGVGYNYKTRTDMATYSRNFLSGWSAAFGIRTSRLGVGIALAQPTTGATTLMFNLSLNLAEIL